MYISPFMQTYCTPLHSYICIMASHVGAWDEQEERGDGAEPEDGVW